MRTGCLSILLSNMQAQAGGPCYAGGELHGIVVYGRTMNSWFARQGGLHLYWASSSGSNSVVECDLAKVEVAGSTPVSRSSFAEPRTREGFSF
jgi:hypothetical protein